MPQGVDGIESGRTAGECVTEHDTNGGSEQKGNEVDL